MTVENICGKKVLWTHIKESMLKNPTQVVCEQRIEITYKELIEGVEIFAEKLEGEKCCAIMCESEMAAALAVLSCFAAGVTAVPLSERYGGILCKKILKMVSPTAVIMDSDTEGELRIICMENSSYNEPEIPPALIMCSSGTTGKPKGIMLSEENIMTNLADISDYFDIGSKDTILIARPLYHCAVLTGEFLVSLVKGVKICFCSNRFNPAGLLRLLFEYEISVMGATPTLYSMMARFADRFDTHTLKSICISGECMSEGTGRKIAAAFPKARIYHVYGLTEACPRISFLPPEKFLENPDSVGIPLKSVELRILKTDGSVAALGEEGIVWAKGKNIMCGYYNDPELTDKVLKDGWLCTGDVGVVDKEGLLRIKGRQDNLIIRAGMNIYPQEIEETLKTDPRVKEAVVYGIPSIHYGTEPALKVVGTFSGVEQVRELCLEKLPLYQIPVKIQLVNELPKSVSGKVLRVVGNHYADL